MELRDGFDRLRRVLGPVGDTSRERGFRMNLTLCLHRAVSDEELRRLDVTCMRPTHLAGGPVEVLWETEPGVPSTQPCRAPRMTTLLPGSRVLVPMDCGECDTCRARAAVDPLPPVLPGGKMLEIASGRIGLRR